MAVTSVSGIEIKGIVSVLPAVKVDNTSLSEQLGQQQTEKIIQSTGIQTRRVVEAGQTALDLAYTGCSEFLSASDWSPESIGLVLFVTQTPDFQLPGNAVQLQHKLGLSKSSIAFDVNLGCSGFVHGLWQAAQLLSGLSESRALLVVGDTTSNLVSDHCKAVAPLFGDAVSVVGLEKQSDADTMVFSMGSDGAGAPYLIQPGGAARQPEDSTALTMEGMQVFVFTLREVSASVSECLSAKDWEVKDVDFAILHQANEMMLKRLGDKLGLTSQQLVVALSEVGNCSSASIPLALTMALAEQARTNRLKLLMSGFGVGWSWGSLAVTMNPLDVCKVVDLSNDA